MGTSTGGLSQPPVADRRSRRAAGWALVAAGAAVAAVAGAVSIVLVADNVLDSPTTAGWAVAVAAFTGGVIVGAALAGWGLRWLAVRGWWRVGPLALAVSVPATLTPWVLAAVLT